MSYSIDLNLLLFAVDEDSPFHAKAKAFLKSTFRTDETCFLTWETLYGFLRIATNSRIFRRPFPMTDAIENVQALLAQPRVQVIASSRESWEVFVRLAEDRTIKGNLVPDAVLASILEANAIRRLVTHDTDFRKFAHLSPVDPLSDAD